MDRQEWLTVRRCGIGGSDVAPILGLSPWRSAMDVWLEKKGLREEKPDPGRDFFMDLGTRLEPVIAALYERETGNEVVIPVPTIWAHPQYPALIGTPDRIGANAFGPGGPALGVELKSENEFRDQFGDPGTAEVPIHYSLQCAHYMSITGLPRWDVAVLHSGTRFAVYTLERDLGLEQMIVSQLVAWWEKHIIGNVPPDVDGSDAWRLFLHRKFPEEMKPVAVEPEHSALVDSLRRIRDAEKALDVMRTQTENQLKEIIGERAGISTDVGRVTWKKTKDGIGINWESAFRAMAAKYGTLPEMQSEILKPHTYSRLGSRRFLFTPRKDFYGVKFAGTAELPSGTKRAAALPPGNSEHGTGGPSESSD